MVKKRESIVQVGKDLSSLIIEGGTIGPTHKRLAESLLALCEGGGVYRRRYKTHEERVLHRHLNLYKNKLASAKNAEERLLWSRKLADQENAIAAHKAQMQGGRPALDLDDL